MNRSLIAASLAIGLAILAGCGTTAAPGPAPAPQTPAAVPAQAPPTNTPPYTPGTRPASFSVPSIGASSTLVPVGLEADGEMAVPDVHHPKQAGWFEPGPEPGQNGPAVIVGHIDGDHIPGVFYKLHDVKVGDAVEVKLTDGKTLTFHVYRTALFSKDAFPADEVFGYRATPELELVTCGGEFDRAAHSYVSNTVVFAKLG